MPQHRGDAREVSLEWVGEGSIVLASTEWVRAAATLSSTEALGNTRWPHSTAGETEDWLNDGAQVRQHGLPALD